MKVFEFTVVLITQFVNIFTIFFLTKLMTVNFQFHEIAAYSIVTIVQNFNIQLFGGPLSAYIGRFYRLRVRIPSYMKVKASLILIQFFTIFISVGILLLYIDPMIFGDEIISVYLIISAYITLFLIQLCLIAILDCQRLRVQSLIGQLSDSVLRIILLTLLLYFEIFTLLNVISIFCVSLVISNIVLSKFVLSSHEGSVIPENGNVVISGPYTQRVLMNFISPLILWGIVGWAYQSTNRVALNEFGTAKELAVYYVYYQLFFVPASFFFTILSKYYTPILRELNDRSGFFDFRDLEIKMIFRLNIILVLSTIMIVLVLVYFDDWLIALVTSDEYIGDVYLYFMFIFSGACVGYASLLSVLFNITLNNGIFLKVSVVSSLVGVFTGPILINSFGLLGGALSLSLHSCVLLGYTLWERRKLIACS